MHRLNTVRRILVPGATGGVGRYVIEQADATDLEITPLVRTPGAVPATARQLRVVTGDIRTDSRNIRGAFARRDAVISVLGVGQSFKSGGLIGSARVGERLTLTGSPRVLRADAAAVLLRQFDDQRFVGKGVLVAN